MKTDIEEMFISGVLRVFSSLEEGETFGSKEVFAKRLWNDSNVQYALTMLTDKVREEERENIKDICNRCKTERGLARAIGNYLKSNTH